MKKYILITLVCYTSLYSLMPAAALTTGASAIRNGTPVTLEVAVTLDNQSSIKMVLAPNQDLDLLTYKRLYDASPVSLTISYAPENSDISIKKKDIDLSTAQGLVLIKSSYSNPKAQVINIGQQLFKLYHR